MRIKMCLIVMTIFSALVMSNCGKNTTVSDEMLGTWRTSTIKYRDTSFELMRDKIIFKTKDGDINVHYITKTQEEKLKNDEWVLYTVHYMNRELQKIEFPFYFHPSQGGLIRFKNQEKVVWRKAEL